MTDIRTHMGWYKDFQLFLQCFPYNSEGITLNLVSLPRFLPILLISFSFYDMNMGLIKSDFMCHAYGFKNYL